jgi:betaine-homocysteine S-methyltransferase
MASPNLLERLDQGPVICAEGYVFEMERRGYVQAGAYVPEVVLEDISKEVEGPLAALPVPYRTTPEEVNFQALTDSGCDCIPDRPFPTALDSLACNRYEIAEFAKKALALGARYQGVCCGAGPHHIRAMAEALGKNPPASRYSPDMSKHYALGSDEKLVKENLEFAEKL